MGFKESWILALRATTFWNDEGSSKLGFLILKLSIALKAATGNS
jgi:hypothetical protein